MATNTSQDIAFDTGVICGLQQAYDIVKKLDNDLMSEEIPSNVYADIYVKILLLINEKQTEMRDYKEIT